MDATNARRAALVALATAASSLFSLVDWTPLHFVTVPSLVVVILLVAAAVTAAAAALRRADVVLGVGAVLLLLGLVRLVTYGHGSGLIGGQSSTAALLAGLGMALLGIGVAARPSPSDEPVGPRPRPRSS